MATNDPTQVLSQEQIADVVNRAKLGSQRNKNEMMRLGTSDPTSFQMNFKKQLQEQEAPSEFLGAGRRLTYDQTPNKDLYDFSGNVLPTSGQERFYYGAFDPTDPNNLLTKSGWAFAGPKSTQDSQLGIQSSQDNSKMFDYTKGQWGTEGYNTQDIGDGTYNILDQTGKNIGIGYKSLDDTIRELTTKYQNSNSQPIVNEDGAMNLPQPTSYRTSQNSGGDLEKWEVLGQLLSGGGLAQNQGRTYDLPGNNQSEEIKGLNTLFGSTPLINNGKVLGYKVNTALADKNTLGYVNPNMISRTDNKGATRFDQSLLREYNDLDTWNKLVKGIDENSMYVPVENAAQLPGWTNKDNNQYMHQDSGVFNKVAQGLGAVLSFTPLAPLGAAMSTLGSLQSGNHLGALANVLGNTGAFSDAGKALGDATGLGAEAGKYFVKGGLGAISSLGKGGSGALLSGLGAGLGAAGSDLVSSNLNNTLGQTGSKILGSGVGGGIQSLFSKSNPLESMAQQAISSGLGSFLGSLTNTGNNLDTNRQKSYDNLGKTIINVASSRIKRKK